MWLAEVFGRMRGEEVQLQNNPATEWQCDPHMEVSSLCRMIFTHDIGLILGPVPA